MFTRLCVLSGQLGLDRILSSVDQEVVQCDHKQILSIGQNHLKRARNLSASLAPINILSAELLLSVFSSPPAPSSSITVLRVRSIFRI
jgi:hypothetical protein